MAKTTTNKDSKGGRKQFAVKGLHEPISHYTDAVQFGDLLFISGMAPLDEKLGLVGGSDPAEQARQVFRNMEKVLHAAGATFGDVLRVTVYLTDIKRPCCRLRPGQRADHSRHGRQYRPLPSLDHHR
jgi:enamine deaminase RidA (YjgF/YER057c/UK114 family)